MPYCQLTLEEREVISQMHFSGLGPTAIGRRRGRSPSTISRELQRNWSGDGYQAVSAQRSAESRRRERQVSLKMDSTEINSVVREGLSQQWSPEQIAGRLKVDHPRDMSRRVSHQTIYRRQETSVDREHFRSLLRHGKYRRRLGRPTRGGRDISHHEIAFLTRRLNNRPRKRINYLTPCEVLSKAGIALQMRSRETKKLP
jgi:IS30 family transposase